MYHHKLSSALYLPLDNDNFQTSNLLGQQAPVEFPYTRPAQSTRSPGHKFTDFLRQTQPSRSASILSRKSSKTGIPSYGRTNNAQNPAPTPSRFRSVKRGQRASPQLLPAFPSPSHGRRSTDIRVDKPLPSEPSFDFEEFFRRPSRTARPTTRQQQSDTQSVRSYTSRNHFTRDIPRARNAAARYSFILKTATHGNKKEDCSCPLTGLACEGVLALSGYEDGSASARHGEEKRNLDGRCGRCSAKDTYQLGMPMVAASTRRPTSPCEQLSKGRKRNRPGPLNTADLNILSNRVGFRSESGRWMDDAPASQFEPELSRKMSRPAQGCTPDRTVKARNDETCRVTTPLVRVRIVFRLCHRIGGVLHN